MSFRSVKSDFTFLYAADQADGREQLRADAMTRIGATDARLPATFLATGTGPMFEREFGHWLAETFESWLGTGLIGVGRATAAMRTEQIAALDLEIDGRLDPMARERSKRAAIPWLEGRAEVRRQPQWVKYLAAQASGEVPGHLATVFAMQAALFHLPLLSVLTAYVHYEGINGLAAAPGGDRMGAGAFADRYPAAIEAARRVFQRGLGDANGFSRFASRP